MHVDELRAITYPYPGLRTFEAHEAEIFFGREQHIDDLLVRLQRRRFLGVVGPSGCGKSSLIRAGMIPALHAGLVAGAGSGWQVAVMRPGTQPLKNLAHALRQVAGPGGGDEDGFLDAVLGRGSLGLVEALEEYGFAGENNLLLVVDQFEELFRFTAQGASSEARAFVDLLLTSALAEPARRRAPVYVVVTMRSDFLGHCPVFRGLPEALNDSQYLTPRLTREQQRAAIEGPAALFNTAIRPEVVNRILNEMGADPDQLPLMQHLLMRMWRTERLKVPDEQQPVELTMETYREVGGLHGCLSGHAEKTYQALPEEGRRMAELLFRQLAEVSADGRLIRRPQRYDALCGRLLAPTEGPAEREALRQVIEEFRRPGRSFLMPPAGEPLTDGALIDISHESLIRQWETLKGWVQDEHKLTRVSRIVTKKTARWKEAGEGKDYLLFGVELAEAKAWRDKYPARLDADEERLLAESVKHEEDEVRREEAGKFTDRLVRKNRLLKALAIVAGILFILAVVFAVRASRNEAKARDNEARAQAAEGEAKKEKNLGLALMSIKAGMHLTESPESGDADVAAAVVWYGNALALLTELKDKLTEEKATMLERNIRFRLSAAWRRLPKLEQFLHHKDMRAADVSPDGCWAVTGGTDKEARLWDLKTGTPRLLQKDAPVTDVCFSPEGMYVAVASGGEGAQGTIRLWKVSTGEAVMDVARAAGPWDRVAYNKDGNYLLAVRNEKSRKAGEVHVWRCRDGRPAGGPQILASKRGIIKWAEFSPNPNPEKVRLVTAVEDERSRKAWVAVWDPATKTNEAEREAEAPLSYACFSPPDGKYVVSCSGREGDPQRVAVLWGTEGGLSRLGEFPHQGAVQHAAFSPDGGKLVTCGSDGKAKVWSVPPPPAPRPNPPLRVLRHGGFVYWASFSPDGRYVCTACRDRKVRIWDAASGKLAQPPLDLGGGTVDRVAFLRDGHTVAAWSAEAGTVRVWKLLADDFRTHTLKPAGTLRLAAFNDAGRLVTVTSPAGRRGREVARVWDVRTGEPVSPLLPHPEGVRRAALSSDGRRLVMLGKDAVARLWDLEGKRPVVHELHHKSPPTYAAFDGNGTRLVTTAGIPGDEGVAYLWDTRTGEPLCRLTGKHKGPIAFAAFSPDGGWLVTAAGERGAGGAEATVWNTRTGEGVRLWGGEASHGEPILSAAFTGRGDRVVTCSADNTARIWVPATGKPVSHGNKPVVLKHAADVVLAAFSPDEAGQYVVTASMDCTAVVWDARTGEKKVVLNHPSGVESASFSPQGNFVVTVDHGGAIRFWDLRAGLAQGAGATPEKLVSVLRQRGEVFGTALRLEGEHKGRLTAVSYAGMAGTADRHVLVSEWTFERDGRAATRVEAEARVFAHRDVDPRSRDLVPVPDEEVSRVWQAHQENYHRDVPVRSPQDVHVQEADKAEAARQWEGALWHLEEILKNQGNRPDILARRAECYRRVAAAFLKLPAGDERRRKAADFLEKALKDYTLALQGGETAALYAGRARVRVGLMESDPQQSAEALSDYKQAIALVEKDRQLFIEKAELHKVLALDVAARGTPRSELERTDPPVLQPEELDLAIREYTKAIDFDNEMLAPPDANLLADRAYLYKLGKRWKEAVDGYKRAIKARPDDPDAPSWYRERARAREKLALEKLPGEALNAAADYESAAQGFARLPDVKHITVARNCYHNALTLLKDHDPIWEARLRVARGHLYLRLSDWKHARDDFEAARRLLHDRSWQAYEGIARVEAAQWRWADAAGAYGKAADLAPAESRPLLWRQQAQAHANVRQWRRAAEAYSRILRAEKQRDPALLIGRARAYAGLRRWEDATNDYGEALALLPAGDWRGQALLQEQARARGRLGRWGEALAAYDRAIQALPEKSAQLGTLLLDQARLYGAAGRWDEALRAYDKALKQSPQNSAQGNQLLPEKARAYGGAGRWEEAIKAYQEALDPLPAGDWRFPGLLQEQARARGRLGRWGEALAAYDRAIQALPEKSAQLGTLLQGQAWVYGAVGRWDRAVEAYRKAGELQPRNPLFPRLLAQAQAELGQDAQAKDTLVTVRARQEFFFEPSIRSDLARLYLRAGDTAKYKEVRDDLLKRFGKTTKVVYANTVAGVLVLGPEDRADLSKAAVALAETAVRYAPTNYQYLNTLGAAYYRAGKYAEAVRKLNEAAEEYRYAQATQFRPADKDGRADDLLLLALAYARLNKPDEAKKAYAAAVKWLKNRTSLNDPDSTTWSRFEREVLRSEAEKLIKP